MSTSVLNSVQLEREFVSCVFWDADLLDALRMSPDDFSDTASATVLRAQMALRESGEAIEPIGVRLKVEEAGRKYPEEIDYRPDTVWTPRAAKRLHDLAELRRFEAALVRALACCRSGNIEETRNHCVKLGDVQDAHEADSARGLGDLAVRAAQDALSPDESRRLHLGLIGLNNALGGMGVGDMVIVGADTGIGKSSLALSMALGMQDHHPVGIVSCEDPEGIWGARGAAAMTGVSSLRMLTGSAAKSGADAEKLAALISQPEAPLVIVDFKIGRPLSDVLASMRRLAARGARVIMIDYLQAVLSETPSAPRKDQIREITARIKGQAQSLRVGAVCLSQLSRPEKGKDKREPGKHDLKECGDLENMAEIILLLWPGQANNEINLKIEKSKWGARQRLHTLYRDQSGTLREGDRRPDDDHEHGAPPSGYDPTSERYNS